ncbi:MAG TPA: 1-deoxy-D-xylulose-5-phosphate reductoisomerase [Actinomycetota bacterium]|nr:1-deoxy-D-xylulose-5-phosphate reductoisomerase [Actinomycetota bacterium]
MRRIVILGSTGSIGRQALEVIAANPDRFEVVGLGAGSDRSTLEQQAAEFGVSRTALGVEEAVRLATLEDADVVLNAIVGAAGLRASVAALDAGKILALANKESLVAGGEACIAAVGRGGGATVPVDSEHAAIAQCLQRRNLDEVKRIILTASGGPFRQRPDLAGVTPDEALQHPTWSMGPKITVDSATMMNKGLELIEAHFLFGFGYDQIDVTVHPQSIVHGLVEFVDGSMLMQAATTDMRIPIQAALGDPERFPSQTEPLDPIRESPLTFEAVDHQRFPAIAIAVVAGRAGRSYPAVLNAANEIAVEAFLDRKLAFTDISRVVEATMGAHEPFDVVEVDAVLEADAWARVEAERVIASAPVGGGAR